MKYEWSQTIYTLHHHRWRGYNAFVRNIVTYRKNIRTPTFKYTVRLRITFWVDLTMSVRPSVRLDGWLAVHVNLVRKVQVAILKQLSWNLAEMNILAQGPSLLKLVIFGPLFHLAPIHISLPESEKRS